MIPIRVTVRVKLVEGLGALYPGYKDPYRLSLIKGLDRLQTILSLIHKRITPMYYNNIILIIYDRNSPNFRATRRIQFRNFTLYLDLIKRTCLINLIKNNYLII